MKTIKLLFLFLLSITVLNCSTEEISNQEINKNPNFRVTESTSNFSFRESLDEPCTSTRLMAGQNYDAGTVTVDTDGVDLIIRYTTNSDWSINATHLSIGNCGEQTIPTTGAGNPKIGHFEHGTTHATGVNIVEYYINKDALNDLYCFAAHAVVTGPNGEETAWAEGFDFGGNSWAMYVEARQSDCDVSGTNNSGPAK
ncbi:hypothetical protein [Formosa maritima]|uniref:Uncharacterized protein n=1 Tax=Formosa maritima TaxID=2592046 RepID=A0A5D0GNB5_9FLAO|nr:hypothetical protein [Formosa maritima]TYA60200.1 hypothetical protein FVF61_00855 [Formosa maritima]